MSVLPLPTGPHGHDHHGHDHDHDHAACVAGAIARFEARCAKSGARLTLLRRRVLEELADSHTPLGAYDIVERLGASGEKPPPMSVYRALDFLVSEGWPTASKAAMPISSAGASTAPTT
ncbi:hypothetical protein [Ancylobacter sp.]|uniref:hypothetical protein n=1 Tax=Ancylobacter sp. TaxID=1872567 RepID=UPI003C7B1326